MKREKKSLKDQKLQNLLTKRREIQDRKQNKKKKNKNYFTLEHELAIVEYASTDDLEIRTRLYEEKIGPVFDEMVDKIIFTYKFNTLPNIDVLSQDCKTHLVTILNKFDVSKKKKAFSYFTVVAKHWFIHKIKKNSKASKTQVEYGDAVNEIEQQNLVENNPYEEYREYKEFWENLENEINSWEGKMSVKENDKKVYEAVKIVLNSVDELEIFNKKAIYHYLREITKLNTKQVVNSLNKIRPLYFDFKKRWNEGKI